MFLCYQVVDDHFYFSLRLFPDPHKAAQNTFFSIRYWLLMNLVKMNKIKIIDCDTFFNVFKYFKVYNDQQ